MATKGENDQFLERFERAVLAVESSMQRASEGAKDLTREVAELRARAEAADVRSADNAAQINRIVQTLWMDNGRAIAPRLTQIERALTEHGAQLDRVRSAAVESEKAIQKLVHVEEGGGKVVTQGRESVRFWLTVFGSVVTVLALALGIYNAFK